MKCKILFNYFEDSEDLQYSEFHLDLSSINGYYLLDNAIVVIIFGTEYCLLYEEPIYTKIHYEISRREMYKMN